MPSGYDIWNAMYVFWDAKYERWGHWRQQFSFAVWDIHDPSEARSSPLRRGGSGFGSWRSIWGIL